MTNINELVNLIERNVYHYIIDSRYRQSNNPADCCSVLIKTEGCEEEPEVDVEGVEGEALLTENRESSIEPPRRRDSSDPVNLSLNSGTSTTSESSHDIVPRYKIYSPTLLD